MHPGGQPHHLHQLLHPGLLLVHNPLQINEGFVFKRIIWNHLEDGRDDEGEGEDKEEGHDETKQKCQIVAGMRRLIIFCNVFFLAGIAMH